MAGTRLISLDCPAKIKNNIKREQETLLDYEYTDGDPELMIKKQGITYASVHFSKIASQTSSSIPQSGIDMLMSTDSSCCIITDEKIQR